MNTWIVNASGITATLLSFAMYVPAVRAIWRNRHDPIALQAVSLSSQFLIGLVTVLWAVYGLAAHAYWSAAPALVNVPLMGFVSTAILHARHPHQPRRRATFHGVEDFTG